MPVSENIDQLNKMSLGDHLDELRKRIILALIGLIIALAVCLGFGKQLLGLVQYPFNQASERYIEYIKQSQTAQIAVSDKDKTLKEAPKKVEKVKEIKEEKEAPKVSDAKPLKDQVLEDHNLSPQIIAPPRLYTHHPTEKVMVYFKTCILFGIIISSPWIIYQFWAFISAGLYKNEKKFAYRVMPVSLFLFITGTTFFLLVIAPMILQFLMKFNIGLTITDQWRLRDYINMITTLTLVFGIAFQLPILIVAAEKIGLVKLQALVNFRKYVLLALFVVSAVITPPDVVSQISLAIPLYILYEASIIVCRLLKTSK